MKNIDSIRDILKNAKQTALEIVKKHLSDRKYEALSIGDVKNEYTSAVNKANEEFNLNIGFFSFFSSLFLIATKTFRKSHSPFCLYLHYWC